MTNQLCKYCGQVAGHVINTNVTCCQPTAKQCPEYKSWFSQRIKNSYINNKDLIEVRRKSSKEVHSRPSVIEKKRSAMLELHNNDCEKCKTFRINYEAGQRKRSDTMNDLWHGSSKESIKFRSKHKVSLQKRMKRTKQKYIAELNKYGILNINKYSYEKIKVMYSRLGYYIRCGKIDKITSILICRQKRSKSDNL